MQIQYLKINELPEIKLSTILADLPLEKQIQVSKQSEKARKQTLALWYLFKKQCELLNIKYEPDQIKFSEHGKPMFIDQKYYFSLAHCENIALCVIDDHEIGIDIEKIRKVDIHQAKVFTSPKEMDYILVKDSIYRFWVIWCMKEAYLKLTNQSIFDIQKIELDSNLDCFFQKHELLEDYMIITAHFKTKI